MTVEGPKAKSNQPSGAASNLFLSACCISVYLYLTWGSGTHTDDSACVHLEEVKKSLTVTQH